MGYNGGEMSQVFYRKWRPQALGEVVGQEHISQTLLNALQAGRVAHAYLFASPRGTGKTSTGRILAKAVNCLVGGHGEPCNECDMCRDIAQGRALDLVEVDAASNRGIDDIRNLKEKVAFAPNQARYKVYIIDEVHMLTTDASNAILKTLEEPPPHAIFILATTDPHKMLPTITSRCQRFDFHRLSQPAVVSRLLYVCEQEGLEIPPEALKLVARSATGSLRDALNILEQLVGHYSRNIELHQVQELLGLSSDLRAREFARIVLGGDVSAGLDAINRANADGLDLRAFLRQVVECLRELLLVKAGSEGAIEATPEAMAEMGSVVRDSSMADILDALKEFTQIELRLDNYSPLPLELALVGTVLHGREGGQPNSQPPPAQEPAKASVPEPEGRQSLQPDSQSLPLAEPKAVSVPEPEGGQGGEDLKTTESESQPPPETRKVVPVPVMQGRQPDSRPVPDPKAQDGEGVTVERLKREWRGFVDSLRGEGSGGNLDALLRNACEPVALEGETLKLGFYHNFHREKMEDPKYRFLVEKKLDQIYGASYRIECTMVERKKAARPEGHLIDAALEKGAQIISVEEK